MKSGCVQLLMEMNSHHSLETVLRQVGRNEFSACDQLEVSLELSGPFSHVQLEMFTMIGLSL